VVIVTYWLHSVLMRLILHVLFYVGLVNVLYVIL